MGAGPKPPIVEIVKRAPTRRFASVRHGLNYAQVDDVLMAILSRIEALQVELQRPQDTAEVPSNGGDTEDARSASTSPAEDVSDPRTERVARFSAVGEREAARMLAEAKVEASAILAEAGSEVDRIRSEAQAGAGRSVDEARAFLTHVEEDARRMLSDVAVRRRQMTEELKKMQEHLVSVAQDLDVMLSSGAARTDR